MKLMGRGEHDRVGQPEALVLGPERAERSAMLAVRGATAIPIAAIASRASTVRDARANATSETPKPCRRLRE